MQSELFRARDISDEVARRMIFSYVMVWCNRELSYRQFCRYIGIICQHL